MKKVELIQPSLIVKLKNLIRDFRMFETKFIKFFYKPYFSTLHIVLWVDKNFATTCFLLLLLFLRGIKYLFISDYNGFFT